MANLRLTMLSLRYLDATLPTIDDAYLQHARDAFEQFGRDGARASIVSFRPLTTSGLPGYEIEARYGSYGRGYVRMFGRVAFGERTAYVLAAFDSSGHEDWYSVSRAIETRMVRAFHVEGDRAPVTAAVGTTDQVTATLPSLASTLALGIQPPTF